MKNFFEFDEMIRDAFTKGSSVIELGRLPPFHLALGTWHRSRDRPGGRHPFGSYMLNKKWTLGEEFNKHMLRFQQVTVISTCFSFISFDISGWIVKH